MVLLIIFTVKIKFLNLTEPGAKVQSYESCELIKNIIFHEK